MSTLTRYRFRSRWWLPAAEPPVFAALADLHGYPLWWPDVRSVIRWDDATAEVRCRSSLPYTLRLVLRRVEQDERAGRLVVTLHGDLDGVLHAVLGRDGGGTRVDIAQEVEVRRGSLRALSLAGRPALRANHSAMMRRGWAGLCARLTDGGSRHP
ncbi:polyketide cyclase [Saccharomonospora piscinae]|uniref:Polyketide cyclase n=1 Tax=Saccharomonospora piscinae TaxID=687388 RepID=A0A1V9A447_SACPI|nr:polyketide cyclase [Saccharomonospora piscinae]OQO91925.1 polyketide cyclase [Saccharomonospora piscinae]